MEDSKLEKERTEFDKKEKGILHFSLSDEEIDDLEATRKGDLLSQRVWKFEEEEEKQWR